MSYPNPSTPKVLHIIAGSIDSGAARGAYLLHKELLRRGIDSFVMSNTTENPEEKIYLMPHDGVERLKASLHRRVSNTATGLYRNRNRVNFNTGFDGIDLTKSSLFMQADIIHLHWINGVVSIRSLRDITQPVIWTMRDMWPFTGGCHYAMGCLGYEWGCGACPQLGSENRHDLSRVVVGQKIASMPRNLYPVGISRWLSDLARQSKIFGASEIRTISNNVNTTIFSPCDQGAAKKAIGLPSSQPIVLLGAQAPTDFYKGFDLFRAAAEGIDRQDVHFVFFGTLGEDSLQNFPFPYTNLGFIRGDEALRMVYAAADVFVAPSRMEAFGKTVAESLACGTPVVCFDSTGPAEIVEHKITGYKAKPFEPSDLVAGIEWILSLDTNEAQALRVRARRRAVSNYAPGRIAEEYIKLYAEALLSQSQSDSSPK